MTCKNCERLILESADRPLLKVEERDLKDHMAACSSCRDFHAGWITIHSHCKKGEKAGVPEALDRETRWICMTALDRKAKARTPLEKHKAVPAAIVVPLALLTILTLIWVSGTLSELTPGDVSESLSLSGWVALLLIVQNALTLFLAPVLFRRRELTQNGLHAFQ